MDTDTLQTDFMNAYEQYSDQIFRFLWLRTNQRELALDLMQETFMKTWLHIVQHKKLPEFMRAFLYRSARNLMIDHFRKRSTVSLDALRESGVDFGVDTRAEINAGIDAEHVQSVLQKLDEKYRDIVIMRYIDDLGPREIAEALEMSENVVSVRLNRAIKQLGSLLNE